MKPSKSNGKESSEPQSNHATNSEPIRFRLYVAGNCQNSLEAESNLRSLCRRRLPERHEIEIVDVLRDPERALADKVLLTPLLVKLSPDPVHKILGRLTLVEPVLEAMGILCEKSARLMRAPDAPKLQGRDGVEQANGFDTTMAA